MDSLLTRICASAGDLATVAKRVVAAGISSVSGAVSGLTLRGSVTALCSPLLEHDETHYLLVPCPNSVGGYACYVKRMLPTDAGSLNSLLKRRIFHVPDVAGHQVLEALLTRQMADQHLVHLDQSSDFADRLEALADRLDRETTKITGGLLVIGATVAIINPLVGAGIAVKGLFPSLGSKLTKASAEYVGSALRSRSRKQAEAIAKRQATVEVKQLRPECFANPILRALDTLLTNPDHDCDPLLEFSTWPDQFPAQRLYQVTIEAAEQTYADDLAKGHDSPHLNWIRLLLQDGQQR